MNRLLLLQGLADSAIALILALLCLGFGYFVLTKLPGRKQENGNSLFYAFILGATGIFWGMLVLGVFGLLNAVTLGTMLFLQSFAIFSYREAIQQDLTRDVYAIYTHYKEQWQLSSVKIALAAINGLILFIFVLGFVISLVPTVETDSITAYLASAQLFWQSGGIIDVGYIIGNMAKGGFMPLILGHALSSVILIQVWMYVILFVGVVFFHFYLSKHLNLITASLCILILMSMSHHIDFSFGTGKVDVLSITFAIFALLSWHQYSSSGSLTYLLINAMTTGYLASVSYLNAGVGVVYFLLIGLVVYKQNVNISHKLKSMLVWSVMALLAVMPSYAFNWITFSNPFYPHLSDIFGHGVGDSHLDGRGYFGYYMMLLYNMAVISIKDALLLPVDLLFKTREFQAQYEEIFAVFWIVSIFGYFWLLLKPSEKAPRHLTIGLGIGYAVLYAIWTQQFILRYFSLAFPFIFWFGAHTVHRLISYISYDRLLKASLIIFSIFIGFYITPLTKNARNNLKIILKMNTLESYLEPRFVYKATDGGRPIEMGYVLSKLNQWLPPNAKVLNFMPGGFYLGDSIVAFNANGGGVMPSQYGVPKAFYQYKNVGELMSDLKKNHFDYILIHPQYLYLKPEEERIINNLLKLYPPVFEVKGALVIEVKS